MNLKLIISLICAFLGVKLSVHAQLKDKTMVLFSFLLVNPALLQIRMWRDLDFLLLVT